MDLFINCLLIFILPTVYIQTMSFDVDITCLHHSGLTRASDTEDSDIHRPVLPFNVRDLLPLPSWMLGEQV